VAKPINEGLLDLN